METGYSRYPLRKNEYNKVEKQLYDVEFFNNSLYEIIEGIRKENLAKGKTATTEFPLCLLHPDRLGRLRFLHHDILILKFFQKVIGFHALAFG